MFKISFGASQRVIITVVGSLICVILLALPTSKGLTQSTATPGPVTCNQILPAIQKSVTACSTTAIGQGCFAYPSLTLERQTSAGTDTPFTKPGDKIDLKDLKTLGSSPLDLVKNQYGVAVMKVGINSADGATAGQYAALMVFGDASLTFGGTQPDGTGTPVAAAATCNATLARASTYYASPSLKSKAVKTGRKGDPVTAVGRLGDSSFVLVQSGDDTAWVPKGDLGAGCKLADLPAVDPAIPARLVSGTDLQLFSNTTQPASCQNIAPGGVLVKGAGGRKISFSANGATIILDPSSSLLLNAVQNQKLQIAIVNGSASVSTEGTNVGLDSSNPAKRQLAIPLGKTNGLSPVGAPKLTNSPIFGTKSEASQTTLCGILNSAQLGCNVGPAPVAATAAPGPTIKPTIKPPY